MGEALVLSGGGANGAYEVGVIKALAAGRSPATSHQPLKPTSISSTSIGTFNMAVLLSNAGDGWESATLALEKIWLEHVASRGPLSPNGVFRYRPNVLDWIDPLMLRASPVAPAQELATDVAFLARDAVARLTNLFSGSGTVAHRFAELLDLSVFIAPEPSEALVQAHVSCARVRQSPVDVRVTATDWKTGGLKIFANADFVDGVGTSIVRASGAIPGIFPPVNVNAGLYVDGGVVLNTPLKPAIKAGADVVHVIYLDPIPRAIPLLHPPSTIDTIGRMFVASFAATMRRDIDVAASVNRAVIAGRDPGRLITIHLYHPLDDTGGALGMLDFGRDRVASLIDRGYKNAIAHDCVKSGCVIPGKLQRTQTTPGAPSIL